jgi:hypothetical protein
MKQKIEYWKRKENREKELAIIPSIRESFGPSFRPWTLGGVEVELHTFLTLRVRRFTT